MKTTTILLGAAIAGVLAHPNSHLTRLADTFLKKGVQPSNGFQEATLYLGIEKAYELTNDAKYLDWYIKQLKDVVVDEDGDIKGWNPDVYALTQYRMANNYLYLYKETEDERYFGAMSLIRQHINSHPRTPSGGFWLHKPSFPNQIWLDGIFMVDSFYARWTYEFDYDNVTAWDDIFHQLTLTDTKTRDNSSGLLVHGWAETTEAPWADPVTGRAPHVWGRAVGWYFMSLVEVLQVFPRDHVGYNMLMHYFTSLAKALKENQDAKSGGWFQVMDQPYPSRTENYIEASASAMFTYGLLKGLSLGYLGQDTFLSTAKVAYQGLVMNFIQDNGDGSVSFTGTVAECGLVSKNATFEYYISVHRSTNDYKGSGPFMLAAYEWETWAKDT